MFGEFINGFSSSYFSALMMHPPESTTDSPPLSAARNLDSSFGMAIGWKKLGSSLRKSGPE